MNSYSTNYRTIFVVTEEGNANFTLNPATSNRSFVKAAVMERLGIYGVEGEDGSQTFLGPRKESDVKSYSSEYELMMANYWEIAKVLLTETSGNNVIRKFSMDVEKDLTDNNFKVIILRVDFIK